jgi:predicted nucleotidyltransferase
MGIKEHHRGPAGTILPGLKLNLNEAIKRLEKLFASKGVVLVYLFGSHAEGTASASSDLDLAVLLPGYQLSVGELYLKLITDIQKTINTERFDLLLLNNASPVMQYEVVRSGKVIYARNESARALSQKFTPGLKNTSGLLEYIYIS